MLRGEKRVVWVPYWGCSKYPEKKPRRPFGSFISLFAFCLFWIGNHFTYLMVKVFVSVTWIFLVWLNPNSFFFVYFRGILPYQVTEIWTSPNTILLFILIVILVIRYFGAHKMLMELTPLPWNILLGLGVFVQN